jgi:hypothetical protein
VTAVLERFAIFAVEVNDVAPVPESVPTLVVPVAAVKLPVPAFATVP